MTQQHLSKYQDAIIFLIYFQDVALCVRSLPNVVLNKRVSDLAFNHIDFFFSEHAIDQVYLPVLKLLQKY